MTRVRAWLAAHRKLIVALTGAALTLAIQVWGTGEPVGVVRGPRRHVAGRVRRAQPGPAARRPGREDAHTATHRRAALMTADTTMTRRNLMRLGLGAAGTVVLLRGGGRALAGPASAAVGASPAPGQPAAMFGRMFPKLPAFTPDPDPATALADLAQLADNMLEPGGGVDTTHGALYTYFGQFVDHDITLDLEPQPSAFFSFAKDTARSPLLDPGGNIVYDYESRKLNLSQIYGGGPTVIAAAVRHGRPALPRPEEHQRGRRHAAPRGRIRDHRGDPQRREPDHEPAPRGHAAVPQRRGRHAEPEVVRPGAAAGDPATTSTPSCTTSCPSCSGRA